MGFDVALFGASPCAMLVAGLLASEHGMAVCLVGPEWSPWLLPQRFDLGWRFATRPQAWRLLLDGATETQRLLSALGRQLVEPIAPVLVAEQPATRAALLHMKATLAGLGRSLQQVSDRGLPPGAAAWALGDVPSLAEAAPTAIAAWLGRRGVQRLPADTGVTFRRDGALRLEAPAGQFEAARAVLLDDAAIARLLPEGEQARLLRKVPMRALRTTQGLQLAAPLLDFPDRGVSLRQTAKAGPITALVAGTRDAEARLGSALVLQAPLAQVAEARFSAFETPDGAPLLTLSRAPRALVVAGLGATASFFAPALARHIAGRSLPAEATFFAAHELGRGNARQAVADVAADVVAEAF
jgi:hypothetical protein